MGASALPEFRNRVYHLLHLYNWADGITDLIDALSSAERVQSVVELSLQAAFRGRHYSGLYKAIRYFPLRDTHLMALFADFLPPPRRRPFRLLAERETNVVVRVRGNRVFFCPPGNARAARGHPRWYGERFALDDPATWPQPDAEETREKTDHRGHRLVVHLQAWRGMQMRGSRQWPMHRCPFTLFRVWAPLRRGK